MIKKVSKQQGKAYPLEIRQAVVLEYFTGKVSNKELALKYKLADPSIISHWVRTFRPEYLLTPLQGMSSRKKKVLTDTELSLEQKVVHLRKELSRKDKDLEHARLKVAAYEKLIELAEKNLNISITKKCGSRQ